jgi:hypothetical protein
VLVFFLLVFVVLFAGVAFALLPVVDFFADDFFVAVALVAFVFLDVVGLLAFFLGFLAGFFASGFSLAFEVVFFLRGVVNVILSIATLV